jgi:acyl carrier protein
MTTTQDEVFSQVRGVLVDALGVDEEEVKPDARLVGDLGAESIDFLDIVFRLEKAFGIKIEQSEMFPDNILSDPQYVQDGKVSEEGLAEIRKRHTGPHAAVEFQGVGEVDGQVAVQGRFTLKPLV